MDQASASPAASCACNPAEPRTSSSCSRSAGQSQTAAPPPPRSDPQCEPHAVPSNSRPRPSSPALCRLKAKRLPAAGFLLRRDRESGRFSEGLLVRPLQILPQLQPRPTTGFFLGGQLTSNTSLPLLLRQPVIDFSAGSCGRVLSSPIELGYSGLTVGLV